VPHVTEITCPAVLAWGWQREGGELHLGPLPDCLAEWLTPRWRHFQVTAGGKFQALVSAEDLGAGEMALHIRAAPRADPRVTREVVTQLGIAFFEAGGRRITTRVRFGNRAGYRFALACSMFRPSLQPDGYWHFDLYGHEYLSGRWEPPSLLGQNYGRQDH
jgi:hypothetical protein